MLDLMALVTATIEGHRQLTASVDFHKYQIITRRAYRVLPCPRVFPRLLSLFDEVDCARVSAEAGYRQMNEVGYGSF
jgi:hypothetical protein